MPSTVTMHIDRFRYVIDRREEVLEDSWYTPLHTNHFPEKMLRQYVFIQVNCYYRAFAHTIRACGHAKGKNTECRSGRLRYRAPSPCVTLANMSTVVWYRLKLAAGERRCRVHCTGRFQDRHWSNKTVAGRLATNQKEQGEEATLSELRASESCLTWTGDE
jgi:hypothetical protein